MKKFILFILFIAVAIPFTWSQFTVSGKVTNAKKQPLEGANVSINGTSMGTITDRNGNFTIKNLKGGQYDFVASYLGYNNSLKPINIKQDTEINYSLTKKSIMTGEVIISSIKAGNKTPVAKTNISKEELNSLNAADDIPLLLSMTPSVVSTTESGIGVGYSSMRIRGTDATRINVTVNGIPLNDSESQNVFWVNMPNFSSSVDEVQIQRGVGTSTNGAAAFGATINFNTTSYTAKPFTEISSTIGSFNTYKNSINASTGLLKDKVSFDIRYSDMQTDGYVDYTFSDHKSLYMSGTMLFNNSFLKANIIHGNQQTGISWWGIDEDKLENDITYNPAGQYKDENGNKRHYKNQTDNYIQTHYQLFYSNKLNPNWLLNSALHYTKGEGYYEQYKEDEDFKSYNLEEIIRQPGDTIRNTDLIRQKWLTNDFYGFTSSLNYSSNNLQMNFGGGWNKYDGDHFGEIIWARYTSKSEKGDEWYKNTGIKKDYNIYAKANFQVSNKLNVFADLQYRGISYKMKGSDDDLSILNQNHQYDFFNPKTGIFYSLDKSHQFYASYAVANREPTRTDFKNANGDHTATPKSERLNDFELGYHFKSKNMAANINFYYMQYKDQLIPTGEKSSVGSSIMTNVEHSYRTGVELDLGIQILPKLRWDGNATFSKNMIKDFIETATTHNNEWSDKINNWTVVRDTIINHGNSEIAFSPSFIANSIFTYKPIKGNKIRLITKHIGDQYFDNTGSDDRKLDAYTIFNASITQEFSPKWINKIEFQLSVNNLLNKTYVSNAYIWQGTFYNYETKDEYTYNYYYPQAGTHGFLRVRFIF